MSKQLCYVTIKPSIISISKSRFTYLYYGTRLLRSVHDIIICLIKWELSESDDRNPKKVCDRAKNVKRKYSSSFLVPLSLCSAVYGNRHKMVQQRGDVVQLPIIHLPWIISGSGDCVRLINTLNIRTTHNRRVTTIIVHFDKISTF